MSKSHAITKLVLGVTLLATSVHAQSTVHRGVMGRAVEAYDLGNGLLATVTREPNQRVSEIIVERRQMDSTTVDCSFAISDAEALALIDKLVPEEVRGPKAQFYLLELGMGQVSSRSYDFENVRISLVSSFPRSTCQKALLVITPNANVWLPW